MGGFVSKDFDEAKKALSAAASVALASMTKAADTIASYLSAGLPRAAASACEALKTASEAASGMVVGLAKKMFRSSAAAAAVATFDKVAQAIVHGVSSSVAAVQEAVAALLYSFSKLAAPMVAEVKALVKRILSVEFDRFVIPTKAKVAIAVIGVAAVLCVAFYFAAGAGAMMIAPGCVGIVMILRAAFEANPGLYFSILRAAGPAAAAAAFSFPLAFCVSSAFLLFLFSYLLIYWLK